MKLLRISSFLVLVVALLTSNFSTAQTTVTIGTGTSSSSTRGPFQRSDTNSTTVFSRFVHVYTASELATAGLTNGNSITQLNWELASSSVIVGTGNANMKIYVKNSTATKATSDTWANLTTGSTLVLDEDFNTTNNFPGANGWMPFTFTTPITYTGGALEIAVDWDCSQVSTPAFSDAGEIKWRWESTAPDSLVVKKTSSSSASSSITDVKNERANIQIVYSSAACDGPSALNANPTSSSANLNWTAAANATSYNWIIVAAGAGSAATPITSGMSAATTATATGLTALTSYDLYVESDCGATGTSGFSGPFSFMTLPNVQNSITIGSGTSSSSTRGPLQRSDTSSTTVYSRWFHVYTAVELATAGLANGATVTSLNWDLASSNTIIGSGNANLKVYIKNSTATSATSDTWANLITGSDMVVNTDYNTSNNFPGANGWMPFNFNAPFVYTGGAIEIAVDWDCSQVSSPAFDGDGSLKWRWESTAPDDLVVKQTSSSSPSTTLSDVKDERANIQIVFASTSACDPATALMLDAVTLTTADLSWTASANAATYSWRVVAAGAGASANAADSGTTAGVAITASNLAKGTSYDLFVEADCGGTGTSGFAGPLNFTTLDDIGVDDIENLKNISISPNPTNGVSVVELELFKNAQVGISVYSLTGQLLENLVHENVNQLRQTINLAQYQNGLYFVIVSVDDKISTQKIVLIK